MFDWNDEELTNIIWGEAGESNDHIVPYQEATEDYCKKKEWSEGGAGSIKSTELKLSGAKVDIHGRKLESSSNVNLNEGTTSSGLGMLSWPNLPASNAANTDQDSLNTSVSNSLIEFTKLDSSGNETAQLNKGSGICQNSREAKEQGDFVDYGWDNIRSFEDLDRIFSNDDTIFGNVSLANADELWSSSKDITNSSVKSFPPSLDSPNLEFGALRNTTGSFEIKREYVQEDDQPFSLGHGQGDDHVCNGLQNADGIMNNVACVGEYSKTLAKEQIDLAIMGRNSSENSHFATENHYKQKKLLNSQKNLEQNIIYQHLNGNLSSSGNPSGHFKDQYSVPIGQSSLSPLPSKQRQIPGPKSLQFQHLPDPFLSPSAYGGITNSYAAMPMVSHIQSREFKRQPLLSGFEAYSGNVNPVDKIAKFPVKTQTMTPQEKIEKLRRRQQMQAMLAIQEQQCQFAHQVSCSGQSLSQKCPREYEKSNVDWANVAVEESNAPPSFHPSLPIEQDDSSAVFLAVGDYLVEDKILFQLQEIIAKLDVRIRLCVRDSLFRLAHSAKERQQASDTSSTNNDCRDGVVKDETGRNRNPDEMLEVETETNPIDRTVAYLLFHRPLDLSGKPPGTPESPVSSGLLFEHKTAGIPKLSKGCLPETIKCEQNFSQQESKSSCPLADSLSSGQCKSSICLDMSENGSNNGPADEVARELEAS